MKKIRVAVNITEYHIISKLIFLRFKFQNLCVKAIISCKNVLKNVKINMFKMNVQTFGPYYRVTHFFTSFLTVSGMIIPSFKSKGQF